ncbi:MAG: 30S ribosomal protein S20 [SAR202 cluster bacterium]|nr:30S ribosomal protein S20 [Chloroflexota bacterium]MDP6420963.1 30S ribosomal protein S20 [SAR202 cluster bacterium]HAL46772.1 30S ribosomal protein S20 [Dehalococcoidia bacterium]MDP6665081.1 30S ribosomal protein S20 [SAR202 cluster bacterium]MDP6799915.1 30S ribosomal protein S20 [SAR202 cluster bacterium]
MPSEKSARGAQRKRAHNLPLQTKAKTQVRAARQQIEAGDVEAAEKAVRAASVALDKAAQKGALHANNAARRKSRIMHQLHQIKND